MANSSITLQNDAALTGKKLDTESLTVSAQAVERQRIQIAGAVSAEIARILNAAPSSGDYGLVTRPLFPDPAHDAPDAGVPGYKIAGRARARSTVPADVAADDRVDGWFDCSGALVAVGAEAPRVDTEGAPWTHGTTVGTNVEINCSKMSHVMVFYDAPTTGTITAGAFIFECFYGATGKWEPISGSCFDYAMAYFDLASATQAAQIGDWSLSNGWRIPCQGFDKIRVRVMTQIAGTTTASTTTTRTTTAGTLPSFNIYLRATTAGHGGGHEVVRQGDPTRLHVTTYGKTNYVTGTITGTGTVVLDLNGIQSNPTVQIAQSGTQWTGTILFEQSIDGISWTAAIAVDLLTYAGGGDAFTTVNGTWLLTYTSGQRYVRVRGATITNNAGVAMSGTAAQPSHISTLAEGNKRHDATDLNTMPLKVGFRALTAMPAAVAAADRVNAWGDVYGRQVTRRDNTFHINHAPAAATQATIAKAAAGAGIRNVCTALTITLSSSAAPTAGRVIFNLRDGATGAGTILWTGALSLQAVAGVCASIQLTDLWIEGTANTAMTLESAAAPAANIFATISWSGTITQ